MWIKIDLNEPQILEKVTSDRFGVFVAKEWKRVLNPFVPRRTGNLIQNVAYEPFKIHYKSRYAHYMYEGEVYVDPQYHVGGFFSPTYGWFSRPNMKKIPSGRSLNYSKDPNPSATDHWDIVAAQSGQLDKLYRELNKGLYSGNF